MMVDYLLKKDVVINGMGFKAGTVVNIPQSMADGFDKSAKKVSKKKVFGQNDKGNKEKKLGDSDED
jgi:hypothetical protein